MIVILLSLLCFNCYGSFNEGKSLGKSNMSMVKKFFSPDILKSVPHYKGIDNGAPETAEEMNSNSSDALQNSEVGRTIIDSMSRDNKYEFDDEDPLMRMGEKIGKDPLGLVAKHLNGEVAPVVTKKISREICEHSGEPSFISCKYKLKASPFYGEHICEEQHEKSIEVCKKELEVKAVYDNKTCEQIGNPVIKVVTATLQEKSHEKVSKAVVERVYKAGIKITDQRHTPYKWRGKPEWTHDASIATNRVQDGTRKQRRFSPYLRRTVDVPIYKNVEVWSWEDRTISHEMRHPHVQVIAAEYRESPVFGNVQVLHKSSNHRAVHETRVIRWDRVLTKSRSVSVPDSIFHWVGGEHHIPGATRTKIAERCVDNNDRSMYGVMVKKACWRKEITYQFVFPSKNNCEALRKSGCSQVSGKCLKKVGSVCVNYLHNMQCFKKFSENWHGCESFASRKSCSVVREECLDQADRFIAGRDVKRACWGKSYTYTCSYPALNNCEELRIPSCKEISHECKQMVGKQCVVMNRTYKCVDGVNENGHVSNCHDLESKELRGVCQRVNHTPEEKQTKSIDGFEHSAIWERTNVFKCQHESKNNCIGYLALGCRVESKKCKKMESDTCVVWEKQLICSEETQTDDAITGSKIPCLDGNCKGEEDINDSNVAESIAKLSVLSELSKDNVKAGDSGKMSFFGGSGRKCKRWLLSASNCCKLDGWAQGIIAKCSFEEKQLAHFRKERLCHDVGDYCSLKNRVTGGCLVKKNSYCCFKGVLQRVIQQGGRKQLGLGWGTPQKPDCRGLTAEEFSKVNFDLIDFSEVHSSVVAKFKAQAASQVQANAAKMIKKEISRGSYDSR